MYFIYCPLDFFPGFSDSEVAVMSPDAADLADRLDLSVSSIDMTNTALAMHEEKDCDISGIGKEKTFILVSCRFLHRVKGLKMFVFPVVQRS